MARIINGGFELNTTTDSRDQDGNTGSPTVQGTIKRTGNYALQISSLSSGTKKGVYWEFNNFSGSTADTFFRVYFRYTTLPSADNTIIQIGSINLLNNRVWITLSSTGTLKLVDGNGNIGSASSALSADTWYRIEVELNASGGAGACVATARIDGTNFASASNRTFSSYSNLQVGGNMRSETQTTGVWYFDDCAINNTSGSYQNSWAGDGGLILLVPNASGDSASWTRGGTDSGANWSQVDEYPPDSTDYNSSTTLNQEDLFNCTASGIGASDTVNVVAVGVYHACSGSGSQPTFKLECEKTSGGTIEQGTGLSANSTAFRINGNTTAATLVLYKDPDGASWTQTTLDSMQIGYKLTTDAGNSTQVGAIWAYVDYTVGVASTSVKDIISFGMIAFPR